MSNTDLLSFDTTTGTSTSTDNTSTSTPDSLQELLDKGDGYLTPAQRAAFEAAIAMVIERLQITLGKAPTAAEQADRFDFSRYIGEMEERFVNDAKGLDELQQDAALTAARVIEHIADIISGRKN